MGNHIDAHFGCIFANKEYKSFIKSQNMAVLYFPVIQKKIFGQIHNSREIKSTDHSQSPSTPDNLIISHCAYAHVRIYALLWISLN